MELGRSGWEWDYKGVDGNGIRKEWMGMGLERSGWEWDQEGVDGNGMSRRWKEEEGKRGDDNADRGKANRSFESAFIQ